MEEAPESLNELFILENHVELEDESRFAEELEDLLMRDDNEESKVPDRDQQSTFVDETGTWSEEDDFFDLMDLDGQEDVLPGQENCESVLKLWQLDGDVKWCANKVWSSLSHCRNAELERPPPSTDPLESMAELATEQIQSKESKSCSRNWARCKKKHSSKSLAQAKSLKKSTSKYKGVHRHVRSKPSKPIWEAHCWNPFRHLKTMQNKEKNGAQEYLGQYLIEEEAARAHDKAAIKLGLHLPGCLKKGKVYEINFPKGTYDTEMAAQADWSVSDYMWYLRRWSYGFTKGRSGFKGVSKREAKWEARFGCIDKNKVKRDYYLGLLECEEEAAKAYDRAVLHFKGWDNCKAVTNFRPGDYDVHDVASFGKKLEEKHGSKLTCKLRR